MNPGWQSESTDGLKGDWSLKNFQVSLDGKAIFNFHLITPSLVLARGCLDVIACSCAWRLKNLNPQHHLGTFLCVNIHLKFVWNFPWTLHVSMLLFSLNRWLTFCFPWHVHVASHMLTCLSWSASLHHRGLYCGYLNSEWCGHGSALALNGWQKAFGWASGGGARQIQSALEAWLRSQGSQDVPDAEGMPSVCFTFSFPQDMNAKEGTSPVKPVEALVQTYILSFFHCSFNSWIVMNSTSTWWLVSLGFPLSHACCHLPHLHFHMLNWHLWSWRCIWHIVHFHFSHVSLASAVHM